MTAPNDLRAAELAQDLGKVSQEARVTQVDDHRSAVDGRTASVYEVGKRLNQRRREIVDAEIAQGLLRRGWLLTSPHQTAPVRTTKRAARPIDTVLRRLLGICVAYVTGYRFGGACPTCP